MSASDHPPTSASAKQVRFAHSSTIYALFANTPPISRSDATDSSSAEEHALLAAQRRKKLKRQRHASLPTQLPIHRPIHNVTPHVAYNTILRLHFLLAYSPRVDPVIHYNLTLPPSTMTGYYHAYSLLDPATDPPVPSLTITCRRLHWSILVMPSQLRPTGFVSVLDVISTVHHNLDCVVDQSEYEAYLSTESEKLLVNQAYFKRCRAIHDQEACRDELGKGVKRIDFLAGRNVFLGLSATRREPNVWQLNIGETRPNE